MGSDKIEFYPHGMLKVCCNNWFLDKDLNLVGDRITAEAIKQKEKLKEVLKEGMERWSIYQNIISETT